MNNRQLELQIGTSQQVAGSDGSIQGDLNLIPSLAPGGDSTSGIQRTISYIEFNDGKVCWYYPIFPEVANNHSAAVSRENQPFQDEEDVEDVEYYYDESVPISNAAHGYGDYPWGLEEYYLEDWYMASNQQPQQQQQEARQQQLQYPNNTPSENNYPQPGSSSAETDRNSSFYYKYLPFEGNRWMVIEQ